MSNLLAIAAAVSSTAAFARLIEWPCLRRMAMLGMGRILLSGWPSARRRRGRAVMMPQSRRGRYPIAMPGVRTIGEGGVRATIAALLAAASALAGAAEISGHIDLTSEGKELRAEE